MRGHVALQLGAVGEGVVAERAGEVLLILLMAVLDVLLERRQPLVAPVAIGAGQQLGEGIWRSRWQVWSGGWGRVGEGQKGRWREGGKGKAGQKVRINGSQTGPAARHWYGSYLCNLPHMSVSLASSAPPPPSSTHSPTHTHMHTMGGRAHFFLFFFFFSCAPAAGYQELNPHLPLLFPLSLFLVDRGEGGSRVEGGVWRGALSDFTPPTPADQTPPLAQLLLETVGKH